MNAVVRLGGFAVALAAVFAAAFGVGRVAGLDVGAHESPVTGGGHGADEAGEAAHLPGGLQVADRGYTLRTVDDAGTRLAYRILGPDGRPVTRFDVVHDKPMHLIVVRRDLSGFRHVHPSMDADGTWRVESPVAAPGVWRAYADFQPTGGPALVLGTDVHRSGEYRPEQLPAAATESTVDGYRVTLDGQLEPGRASTVTLTVRRDGQPVADLEPYLGSYGHLVALRQSDLAYLHVHPEGASRGAIRFVVEVPSNGTYRLFLDFQRQGVVRTASFTANVEGAGHGHR